VLIFISLSANYIEVAIAAGRLLAERLYNNKPYAKFEYKNVPTVIFTHPPLGLLLYLLLLSFIL
jgi:pyruvate/2-oxoglutarate dehydrogenase complex dihydrolipoamide dehydrogenase (E3) component